MEAMALHQESAFERLYRWTQSKLPLDFIAKISNVIELRLIFVANTCTCIYLEDMKLHVSCTCILIIL